jgi:hypothetical protein
MEAAVLEGLQLVPADNDSGFACVSRNGSKYQAKVQYAGGITMRLGTFATAQEAALQVARHKHDAAAKEAAGAGSGSSRKRHRS